MHEHAAELATTLRRLATTEDDVALADALLEAVAKIERFADYKLRNQAQTVIGDSYLTLSDRVDALLNISRDTHQLVMSVQADQQREGAAVAELRDGFQTLCETVSGFEARLDLLDKRYGDVQRRLDVKRRRLDAHDRDLADLKAAHAAHQDKIDRLAAAVAARPTPEKAHATYDGVQRILAHLGLDADGGDGE